MIKKEFVDKDWIMCLSKIRKFIVDYNLEIIKLNLKKENNNYIAEVVYDLGVKR